MSIAKEIKKEIVSQTTLKASEISARYSLCGYSDSVNIQVKNERFPLSVIETITEKHQSIDRCVASGEILSGGNTYIDVSYPWDADLTEDFENEILEVVKSTKEIKYPSDWDKIDCYKERFKVCVKLLKAHLNSNSDAEYTDSDSRAILGRVDHTQL